LIIIIYPMRPAAAPPPPPSDWPPEGDLRRRTDKVQLKMQDFYNEFIGSDRANLPLEDKVEREVREDDFIREGTGVIVLRLVDFGGVRELMMPRSPMDTIFDLKRRLTSVMGYSDPADPDIPVGRRQVWTYNLDEMLDEARITDYLDPNRDRDQKMAILVHGMTGPTTDTNPVTVLKKLGNTLSAQALAEPVDSRRRRQLATLGRDVSRDLEYVTQLARESGRLPESDYRRGEVKSVPVVETKETEKKRAALNRVGFVGEERKFFERIMGVAGPTGVQLRPVGSGAEPDAPAAPATHRWTVSVISHRLVSRDIGYSNQHWTLGGLRAHLPSGSNLIFSEKPGGPALNDDKQVIELIGGVVYTTEPRSSSSESAAPPSHDDEDGGFDLGSMSFAEDDNTWLGPM